MATGFYAMSTRGNNEKKQVDLKNLYKKTRFKKNKIGKTEIKNIDNKDKIVEYEIVQKNQDPFEDITPSDTTDDITESISYEKNTSYTYRDKLVDEIDGIGPSYKLKLNKMGIRKISDLLAASKTPDGIKKINNETGIYTKLLENWLIKADFLRIQAIRNEQIENLLELGINSTSELADISPETLHKTMLEKYSYKDVPSLGVIKRWIRLARDIQNMEYL